MTATPIVLRGVLNLEAARVAAVEPVHGAAKDSCGLRGAEVECDPQFFGPLPSFTHKHEKRHHQTAGQCGDHESEFGDLGVH